MPHSGVCFLFPTESEMCVPVCEQDIKETLMHAVGLLVPCCCLAGLSGEFLKSGTMCTLCSSCACEGLQSFVQDVMFESLCSLAV